jgi:hypothetical protein
MSDKLVTHPHLAIPNYSGQLPFMPPRKSIRSSSFLGNEYHHSSCVLVGDAECFSRRCRVSFPARHVTNISSSSKSAYLIPYYPIPIPCYCIRSRRPCVLSGSEMPSAFLGPQNSAILYSKLFWPEGGIEPDLNGFLNQKQSAANAGRVDPQLNGFEGGIESDLNYFFLTVANTHQYATPLPFRDREAAGGLGPKGRVAKYSEAYPVDPKSEPQLNGFYREIADKHPKGKPQLNGLEGGFEPDLNGFLNQKQSASTAGRGCRRCQVHVSQMPSVLLGAARRYPKGTEYSKSSKRPKGKPDLNYFFSTEVNTHHYATSLPFRDREAAGGLGPNGRVAKRTKGKPQLKGGFEPDLNYFFPSLCDLTPGNGIKSKEAFELDSNRTVPSINQAKILFQSQNLPPTNPATRIKIDLQNILIGFGGSRSSPEGGGGGRGRVRAVEIYATSSKIRSRWKDPMNTISKYTITSEAAEKRP